MDMQCVHYKSPEARGPCFPPNQRGNAAYLLMDVDDDGKMPTVPICLGHLQRLTSVRMVGICFKVGIELLVDENGIAYIDPAISAEWEAEWEAESEA